MSRQLASVLSDDMVAGGLADDFDGIVREARWVEFDYEGKAEKPTLAVRLKIERLEKGLDDDEKTVTQHYSAGSLEFFKPSNTPDVDNGDYSTEGIYAKPCGTAEKLKNNTRFAQLSRSLTEAGVPKTRFGVDIRFIEGIKGHWNRLPVDKKGGQIKDQTEEQKKKAENATVLCLTRFDKDSLATGASASASPSSPATASSPAAQAAPASAGNLDAGIIAVLKEKIAVESTTKKTALAAVVLKGWPAADKANAGKATKRVVEDAFLDSLAAEGFLYDAAEGTVQRLA